MLILLTHTPAADLQEELLAPECDADTGSRRATTEDTAPQSGEAACAAADPAHPPQLVAASADYMRALASAAQRTLLPLATSSGSFGAGGTLATAGGSRQLNSNLSIGRTHASANSFSTAAAAATAAGAAAPATGRSSPFAGAYTHLPLSGMPSHDVAGGAEGAAAAAAAAARKSPLAAPAAAAAVAAAVRKCLDKGIPFAVLPMKSFAAVVAAAEQHDCPLAFHILTSACTYFPGAGRHATSSGGAPLDGSAAFGAAGGGAAGSGIGGGGSGSGSGGGGLGALLGRRQPSAAVVAATAAVKKLLEDGEPLYVMSPCEYQRIVLAAQYGVRQLHDMVVAQPAVATAAAANAAAAAAAMASCSDTAAAAADAAAALAAVDAGLTSAPAAAARLALPMMAPPPLAAGSMGRRHGGGHRRGGSIGSEDSFTATVVRFQSGRDPLGGPGLDGETFFLCRPAPAVVSCAFLESRTAARCLAT